MEKNSQSALSARLQQQLEADLQDAKSQTQLLLKAHVDSLNSLLSAELLTTKNAIREMSSQLKSSLESQKAYQAQVLQLQKSSLKRVRVMASWPVLASILLSLLAVVGSGLWISHQSRQMDLEVEQQKVLIEKLTADFCRSPAGLKNCKTK